MQSSINPPDRSATLRKLGEPESVLDALVGLVGTEWRRFQERRDATSLLRFAEAIDTTRTQLGVLHTLLERMPGGRDVGPAVGVRRVEGADSLRQLEEELVQTLSEADSLRSEAEPPQREADTEGPEAGEPGAATAEAEAGVGEREPVEANPAGAEPEEPAGAEAQRAGTPQLSGNGGAERGQAVEAILSRIHADWQHYRRRPSREQVGILEDEIRQALDLVRGLGEILGSPARRPSGGRAPWIPEPSAVPFPPYRDQATGLYSRQGFDAAAAAELKKCRRHERPFSILLLELAVADLGSLRTAAAQVRRTLRESDLVGRHVDRTLAVGLSETASGDADVVGGRVVDALESVEAWSRGSRLGLAAHPGDGETLLGLLDAARDRFGPSLDEAAEPEREAGPAS